MVGKRLTAVTRRSGACALVTIMLLTAPIFTPSALASPGGASTSAANTATVTPDRTPPRTDATSPIDVPVDAETAEFRAELARRQALLDAFLAQLDALDRELSLAAEAYNSAVERLDATRQKVVQTGYDLTDAEHALAFQNDVLNERAASIYKQGAFHTIEVLLGSESIGDFVARVKFLNTIGLADAEIAESLEGQRDLILKAAEELKDSQNREEALEFELKARQIEVMLRIQERQEMLAGAQLELLEMLDEHAARRQVEEAALLRSILSGANEAGIRIEPGSPVETAFAYYGIPYLWGGKTPSGFDCSGLMRYVFLQHGVELPHYSGAQFLRGERIAPAALRPGDAVFFGSPIHHVGMYVGGGYFIHAPRTGDFVKIAPLARRQDYAGARRYNWVPRISPPRGARVDTADPLAALRQR